MATHEARCWELLTQLFQREESVKTEEGQEYTNYFFGKKYGKPKDQAVVDYLKSKKANFRLNSIIDDEDENVQRVLDYCIDGRMLLAKSAPCAVQFWNDGGDVEEDAGFFGLAQENETRYLVLFSNSGSAVSHKFCVNSWVYKTESKCALNLGQAPLLFIQFSSDENASFFKDCVLKLNYGFETITEVTGPNPVEQLMRRRLYTVGDDIWSQVQSTVLSLIQETELNVPSDKELPSPKNPLFSCALELKDNWIDAMNTILEDMVLQGVAFFPPEALLEQLNDLEKDAFTINIFLPFCSCDEPIIHESVETLTQKIREIRVGIAGVKVLCTLSRFYENYKKQLTNMTMDVESKTNLLKKNEEPLGKPENPNFQAVFEKLKIIKKSVTKQQRGLGRSMVLNQFYNFICDKPTYNLLLKILSHLEFLYKKAEEGTLVSSDFQLFNEIDQLLRAGSISSFDHFVAQYMVEIDRSLQAIRSYWATVKTVFDEPVIAIERNGKQVIVDQRTGQKTFDRESYGDLAFLGQLGLKSHDMVDMFRRYVEIMKKYLDFDEKIWFELVNIVQMLKPFCFSQQQTPSESGTTSESGDLSDFEVVSQNSSSAPTDFSFVTFSQTFTSISTDEFSPRAFDSGIYRDFTSVEFKQMRSLSNGGYGAVSVATHQQLQRIVVKMFHENVSMKEVEYELETIKKLQSNKHIVRLFGFYFDSEEQFGTTPYGYVMEYMPLTLHTVIHSRGDYRSDAPTGHFLYSYHLLQCLCKIRGMASAFGAIHALNMTHTDIKPANVLVDLYMNIKVCDFGTCGTFDKTQTHEKGTNRYMSPEMLSYDPNVRIRYTTKTDVYSLAITIWELFHRKEPFFEIPLDHLRCEAVRNGERPPITSTAWIPQVDDLVQKCWAQNQDKRPTMDEIEKISSDLIDEVDKNKTIAHTKITVE